MRFSFYKKDLSLITSALNDAEYTHVYSRYFCIIKWLVFRIGDVQNSKLRGGGRMGIDAYFVMSRLLETDRCYIEK